VSVLWPSCARKAKPRRPKARALEAASAFGHELSNGAKDGLASILGGDPANIEAYDPGPKQRIPEAGAWGIIVRKLPSIEGGVDREIKVGRIFYLERLPNSDGEGFVKGGLYKALLRSPWGDLHLWPYEYSTIEALPLVEMWSAGELIFHPLRIDDARLQEIAFYARSRGIGLADAAVMALGTLSGNVGWFEPRPDLAEQCEEMERRVHSTPWRVGFSAQRSGREVAP
jgi:hypothetical protein